EARGERGRRIAVHARDRGDELVVGDDAVGVRVDLVEAAELLPQDLGERAGEGDPEVASGRRGRDELGRVRREPEERLDVVEALEELARQGDAVDARSVEGRAADV